MTENTPAQVPRRSVKLLFKLWPFLRPYLGAVSGAALGLLVSSGMVLMIGQGLKTVIDHGLANHSMAELNQGAVLMIAIIGVLALASGGRFFLVSWIGERVTADLRRAVFDHLISLSPAFFETARTGELLSRLTADTAVIQTVIGSAISQWLRNVLMCIGALALLFVTSAKLALFVFAVVPLILVPLLGLGRRERRLSRTAQDRIADTAAYAEEALNAVRTVQAFGHEGTDRAVFGAAVETSVAAAIRRLRNRSMLIVLFFVLGFGAILLAIWFGGREVIQERMSGGELSAFLFYAVLVATSGGTMTELWGELQRAAGAAERLLELLAVKPIISAPANPRPMPEPARGTLAFDRVSFRYPARPDRSALADFSLEVRPGETVALVGPSGAGKTTVFQLLMRFYDPESGRITVDGLDIREADPAAVRARLGMVPQDPVIFGATALENIRYGRPEASDAEVREAADAAAATEFLDRMPEGLNTFLGQKGVQLSGGQRQRIAIARAILRDPPILLLDEATSALDAESERAVQSALTRLAQGRTTLVIAHRLATVRRADRIVVLDQGRIVSTGTHESLVREGGLYARLAELQFAAAAA